jgi:hypothetical protein
MGIFMALPTRVRIKIRKPVAGEKPNLENASTMPPVYKNKSTGKSKNAKANKTRNKGKLIGIKL